jgi:radical SAM superfamily enzyme YgiQ (UPF0313 family)
MGMLEVSRGCGWGCRFCTLAAEPMAHLPAATILADAETNLAAGVRNLSLTSEDALRYGAATGRDVDPEALLDLLAQLARLRGAATLSIDHANVATVARFDDDDLASVQRLLSAGRPGYRVWLNLGVETAAGDLLAANSGRAKLGGCSPAEWADLCRRQVRRLSSAGFLPIVSLVVGLPGETPDHVEQTIAWVESLEDDPVAVVPVFLTPVRAGGGRVVAADDLAHRHWQLLRRSMKRTLKWLPRLYWRHHAAAGVSLARRLLVQAFGRGYALQWEWMLWRRGRAARP